MLTPCAAHADQPCREVQRAIDAQVVDASDPRTLLRIAPYLGVDAMKTLVTRAASPSTQASGAFDAYLAIGLTRHAEALRLLRAAPRPSKNDARIGRALALLALGDGAETGTIAFALYSGTVGDRRIAAKALSSMHQKRPQMMLYDALEDLDEVVRYHASRVFVELGNMRARRSLLELVKAGRAPLSERAARSLARSGYSFKPEELSLLSPSLRMQVLIADAVHQRRGSLRQLSLSTRSADEPLRAAAHASIALLGAEGLALAKKLNKSPEAASAPEMIAALALSNDAAAIAALPAIDKSGAQRAVDVFWAFTAAGPGKSQLEPDHAGQIARAVEGWLMRGYLDDAHSSLALRAMERCDPLAGLLLARTRLIGPDGRSLRTAIRMIARSGSAGDVSTLVDAAKRGVATTRAEAWRAAARVCRR